jgi:hypothetical protein
MKRMKIALILLILTFRAYSPEHRTLCIIAPEKIQPYEKVWNATCHIESNFDSMAIGDKHLRLKSYGIAQIRQSRLDDFYNKTGIRYTTKDMFNPAKSKQVFLFYASGSDMEVVARLWNGGPHGMKNSATIKYWNLIKKNL